jgi:hypothetical protein
MDGCPVTLNGGHHGMNREDRSIAIGADLP